MAAFPEAFEKSSAPAQPSSKPALPVNQERIEAHSQTIPAPMKPIEKKKAPPAHFFTPEMLE